MVEHYVKPYTPMPYGEPPEKICIAEGSVASQGGGLWRSSANQRKKKEEETEIPRRQTESETPERTLFPRRRVSPDQGVARQRDGVTIERLDGL